MAQFGPLHPELAHQLRLEHQFQVVLLPARRSMSLKRRSTSLSRRSIRRTWSVNPSSKLDTYSSCVLSRPCSRIARAVRRCVALARSLDAIQPANDPAQHRAAARKRIIRAVEDSIHRTSQHDPGSAEAEALATELHDRLDAPGLDDDTGSRPIADIIT